MFRKAGELLAQNHTIVTVIQLEDVLDVNELWFQLLDGVVREGGQEGLHLLLTLVGQDLQGFQMGHA